MKHIKGQKHNHSQTVYWCIFVFLAILSFMGLLCTSPLDAKIYQWIDENGIKHYSNTPPADDAVNINNVDDEYQHDETSSQEKVKSNQEGIDALIEEPEEEKQQVNGEERKKLRDTQKELEKTKPDKPRWSAAGCFSPSYSVQQGRGVYDPVITRNFIEGEYKDLQMLFKGLDGDWAGNARVLECKTRDGALREDIENYTIKSEGKMHSRGQFVLESNLYSLERKTTHREIFRLYLSEETLFSDPESPNVDIELISVSSDELVFVEKRMTRSSSGVDFFREIVTAIKKTGEASFSVKRAIYLNGKLVIINSWYLENA